MKLLASSRVGLAFVDGQLLSAETCYDSIPALRSRIHSAAMQCADGGLAELIPKGARVLVKPNWVHHGDSTRARPCIVTNPRFVLSAIEEVLVTGPSDVVVGDAPIQACRFEEVVPGELSDAILALGEKYSVPIRVLDLRRTVAVDNDFARGVRRDVQSRSEYVEFDLGSESMLAPITRGDNRFRIARYSSERLRNAHAAGSHKYLLSRAAINADVIVSLPKLKLHKKTGITGSLKNLVGINGDKDYLPHHRHGSIAEGGDCYSKRSLPRRLAERCLERANSSIGKVSFGRWNLAAQAFFLATGGREDGAGLDGSWFGNDTSWRMALDVVRLAQYGLADGSISEVFARRIVSITDAVVCGERDGPLSPSALGVGALTVSASPAAAEMAHCALLGLNPAALPIVRECWGTHRLPLAEGVPRYFHDGYELSWNDVYALHGVDARPPDGWIGRIEYGKS